MRWITSTVRLVAAVFAMTVTFVPAGFAHNAHQWRQAMPIAEAQQGAERGGPVEAQANVYAVPADQQAGRKSTCPNDGDPPHVGHPGCCAGLGHCATACGAGIIASSSELPHPPRNVLAASELLLGPGIVSDLTDPPPRSFV